MWMWSHQIYGSFAVLFFEDRFEWHTCMNVIGWNQKSGTYAHIYKGNVLFLCRVGCEVLMPVLMYISISRGKKYTHSDCIDVVTCTKWSPLTIAC